MELRTPLTFRYMLGGAGPWHVHGKHLDTVMGSTGNIVCEAGDYLAESYEAEANARLIAAAPLLLEVVRMLLAVSQSAINRGEFGPNVTRAARIAVAKATGAA